jgi:tetratricopeptide (TPR) repeat protein
MGEPGMVLQGSLQFFEQADLIYRLTTGLEKRNQEVIFLVGAALSAPVKDGAPGIPSADSTIDLVRQEFAEDSTQLAALNLCVDSAGEKRYQAAFRFLQGRLGQGAANEIVRRAVLQARQANGSVPEINFRNVSEEELRILDFDSRWELNPGTDALGKLVSHCAKRFGTAVLTTNFDPLIEVAINKAHGKFFKTALHSDGNLSQTVGQGCHVVHLHGYWYGSDTLHTVGQLQRTRPHLKASLASLLRNKLVVVCGYGGWDDVFTEAILDVVCDDFAHTEVLWAFYAATPKVSDQLETRLSSGLNRGRVSLYAGVDCNILFPMICERWMTAEPVGTRRDSKPSNPVRVSDALRAAVEAGSSQGGTVQGDNEDRPPVVDLCVGRESELERMRDSSARVIFVTGIGGQGKSTLAAQYFATAQRERTYNYYVWRDCKEESERFENQLASVVETLSAGRVSGQDLATQDMKSIVELFMTLTANTSVLLVFDNADHYINLESPRMTSSADTLVRELLSSRVKSRVLLTCRPSVDYEDPAALSCPLAGISLEATRELFLARGARCREDEILDAHAATDGHAFWLDLLALQVAKQSSLPLRDLLDSLRAEGGGLLPEKTLSSIWETLDARQKLVLRSMAEAVRPETEVEIADYLHSEMNYRKVVKALNALRAMNLVVVKRRPAMSDVFELHPIVRQFIWKLFTKRERTLFIDEITKVYRRFISSHKVQLEEHPNFTVLQYWTHTAELDLAAGRIGTAVTTLLEAGEAFAASGYPREFSRTARLLLNSFDWVSDHSKYKGFDLLFSLHVDNLSHLGEWSEAERLLDRFELSVAEKDARYILYCNLKCHCKWTQGQFADALKWARIGQDLKRASDVDTQYDVSHNLALAERDAGEPELAINFFLAGRELEEVLDPDELAEEKGGPHYGNIGRCLHFMGQVDSALICYQKSALLIEKQQKHQYVLNQGYIRRWIGELLLARKNYKLAAVFLEAARLKWVLVSPPKAADIVAIKRQLSGQVPDLSEMSKDTVERLCLDWISGRVTDA